MARELICGWYNLDGTFTYYDIQMPADPVMYAYPGEAVGAENGMKAKMDYNKNLWFIACDNPLGPAIMYLVRVTRLPGDTYSMAWTQIPLITDTWVSHPNQVTIDKLGNVYFPCGRLSNGSPNYYIAKVTNAQDPNPANWVLTWHAIPVGGDDEISGAWGISLSKDHTKLVTYVCGGEFPMVNFDYMGVVTTATMVEAWTKDLGTRMVEDVQWRPYNIETDVSGTTTNDGWAFLIYFDTVLYLRILGIDLDNQGSALTKRAPVESERTVIIKKTGVVTTGDPTNTDEYAYQPVGNGVLGAGAVNSTPGPARQNHGDVVRATPAPLINTRFWAFGHIGGQGGEVREVGAVQNTRVATVNYRYPSIAAVREAYS